MRRCYSNINATMRVLIEAGCGHLLSFVSKSKGSALEWMNIQHCVDHMLRHPDHTGAVLEAMEHLKQRPQGFDDGGGGRASQATSAEHQVVGQGAYGTAPASTSAGGAPAGGNASQILLSGRQRRRAQLPNQPNKYTPLESVIHGCLLAWYGNITKMVVFPHFDPVLACLLPELAQKLADALGAKPDSILRAPPAGSPAARLLQQSPGGGLALSQEYAQVPAISQLSPYQASCESMLSMSQSDNTQRFV